MNLLRVFGLGKRDYREDEEPDYALRAQAVKRYPENTLVYLHYYAPYTNVDYIFRWAMHDPSAWVESGLISPAIREHGEYLFAKPPILHLEYKEFGEIMVPTVGFGSSKSFGKENDAVEFIIDPLLDNVYVNEEVPGGLATHGFGWYAEFAERVLLGV